MKFYSAWIIFILCGIFLSCSGTIRDPQDARLIITPSKNYENQFLKQYSAVYQPALANFLERFKKSFRPEEIRFEPSGIVFERFELSFCLSFYFETGSSFPYESTHPETAAQFAFSKYVKPILQFLIINAVDAHPLFENNELKWLALNFYPAFDSGGGRKKYISIMFKKETFIKYLRNELTHQEFADASKIFLQSGPKPYPEIKIVLENGNSFYK